MSTPTFTAHFNPVTNKFEGVQYATDSFTRPKRTPEEERQAELVESHQMKGTCAGYQLIDVDLACWFN